MSELLVRFSDILVNDNTANRNDCGYALDIGIIVDNFGKSRNIWYAVMEQENIDHHSWVLRCHVEAATRPPEVFASDRDPALITAVANVLPLTFHLYCLHHLNGNVSQAICASIGPEWTRFNNMFWEAYPSYLQRELYACREHWAHAWVSSRFVVGIRTNGRCEVENRINKSFLGPKVSLKQLFDYFNDRSKGQTVQDMVRVRDSSRRQHDNPIERVFPGPLRQLRAYVGPFAVHTSFKEMSASVYYQISTLLLPDGVRTWLEYAIHVTREVGFNWVDREEMSGTMNMFQNDNAYISTQFLLRLITGHGYSVKHLFRVQRIATHATHILAVLADGRYVCDCCMGMNLGVPCRHFWCAMTHVQSLGFHVGVIRRRWYQDPDLDISAIPTITLDHTANGLRVEPAALLSTSIPHPLLSNPLETISTEFPATQTRPTDIVNARTAFHEVQAALRPLINEVQTQEQLDAVLENVRGIRCIACLSFVYLLLTRFTATDFGMN
ncbi:hypothetical protein BDN71DRAFT_906285 [Pleurotus eryngii]|uniref:MULE transposase domain-containing protein n=1 Tax=Pleurotus eryngii TaxID=5323 RepID=A0A9P5ZGK9_PLEER|nr:hypothetical protein BDN71DRAFT_906285 [Pleurotus eryngii]